MTHASLFSGIGGPEVAAAMLGWENAFHCEINPFGRSVLEYWFPDSVSYEDITKTDFTEWRGKIDVLTGGFPCQPFSYAGKRGGREDERYLWPQMLRAIDEIRPTWVVGENVAGITTMVEGGLLAEVGSGFTLFDEGDEFHGYELEQTFTIERICRDLERLGYSVQPVLIPAAAVGAPHRRDRIFIIAHDADTYGGDDERGAGANERESVCEGVQERNEVRKPGESGELRSEIQGTPSNTNGGGAGTSGEGGSAERVWSNQNAEQEQRFNKTERNNGSPELLRSSENPVSDGCRIGEDAIQGDQRNEWDTRAGNYERVCGEARAYSSDTDGTGREESVQPGREAHRPEDGAGMDDRTIRPCGDGELANSIREGLERENESGASQGRERVRVRRNTPGHDWEGLRPENRWADFPTISPVHRGNDGLPFDVDDLSIPFSKWRTESLKAYGNAIVPQVMYQIFKAIETI